MFTKTLFEHSFGGGQGTGGSPGLQIRCDGLILRQVGSIPMRLRHFFCVFFFLIFLKALFVKQGFRWHSPKILQHLQQELEVTVSPGEFTGKCMVVITTQLLLDIKSTANAAGMVFTA